MEHGVLQAQPDQWLRKMLPDEPVVFFDPELLQANARTFIAGFPGLVTYAVKANPRPEVLANLAAAGIRAFDVASPEEMRAVRSVCGSCVLHYNNPVRSLAEVGAAVAYGVSSVSVDAFGELDKLAPLVGIEVAVRFRLDVAGGAYDFGSKFGASETEAVELLKAVKARGFVPSLCFHPGTQCERPEAWAHYIEAAGRIARSAGVEILRLNVGGGFASDRGQGTPNHGAVFAAIEAAARRAFGAAPPALLCEPGRALAAPGVALVLRVKAVRPDGSLVLNDGIYGGLAEWRDMPAGEMRLVTADGAARATSMAPRVIWGPTCDSLDRLPYPVDLPADVQAGDYIFCPGMGAYSQSIATRFNGYGPGDPVLVSIGSGH